MSLETWFLGYLLQANEKIVSPERVVQCFKDSNGSHFGISHRGLSLVGHCRLQAGMR
jgi:hypothetical protein